MSPVQGEAIRRRYIKPEYRSHPMYVRRLCLDRGIATYFSTLILGAGEMNGKTSSTIPLFVMLEAVCWRQCAVLLLVMSGGGWSLVSVSIRVQKLDVSLHPDLKFGRIANDDYNYTDNFGHFGPILRT